MNGSFGPNKPASHAPWLRIVNGIYGAFAFEGMDPEHNGQMTALPHRRNSHAALKSDGFPPFTLLRVRGVPVSR